LVSFGYSVKLSPRVITLSGFHCRRFVIHFAVPPTSKVVSNLYSLRPVVTILIYFADPPTSNAP
jgi:hypothetical protein